MQPDANDYNDWLMGGLAVYGLMNVAGVAAAATGVVHPPWGILIFFTIVGPALGILGVCAAQVFSGKRPFTWNAVLGVVLAMLLAAYLNYQALLSASAAV